MPHEEIGPQICRLPEGVALRKQLCGQRVLTTTHHLLSPVVPYCTLFYLSRTLFSGKYVIEGSGQQTTAREPNPATACFGVIWELRVFFCFVLFFTF